jgi:hypothetical protein
MAAIILAGCISGLLAIVAAGASAYYSVSWSLRHERRRHLVFSALTPFQARIEELRFRLAEGLSRKELNKNDLNLDLSGYFEAAVVLRDFEQLGQESKGLLADLPPQFHPAEVFELISRNLRRVFGDESDRTHLTPKEEKELRRLLGELAELRRILSCLGAAILSGDITKRDEIQSSLSGLREKIQKKSD